MTHIIPPRRDESLTQSRGTTRFMEFLERMTDSANQSEDDLENISLLNLLASISVLQARIGSGDPLTSDTTGFSVDSTQFTVDMTEA